MKKLEINRQEVIDLFCSLVQIDSESGNEADFREYLQNKFTSLNIESTVDSYGNLIANIAGTGEPIMLSCHMDTVKPGKNITPVINDTTITSNGETILGADDKAGIAAIIFALSELQRTNQEHRAVQIVFCREEEVGCLGAKNLDYNLIKAKECLVLDHTAQPGKIVMGAPFLTDLEITITGRAAHASMPENGINSIAVAALAISKLKIGRIDNETTSNVGIINGGRISNGVPEITTIRLEVRSHNQAKHDKWLKFIQTVFTQAAKRYGAELKIQTKAEVIGYSVNKSSELYKNIKKIWKGLGIITISEKIGGASDANIFNSKGIIAIPLGSGGQHPHTLQESIDIREIEDMIAFLIKFLAKIDKKPTIG